MSDVTAPQKPTWLRRVPLLVILAVAIVGAVFLSDRLSFEALAEHRAALLEWRAAHGWLAALIFVAVYVLVVAFSIPGALVLSLTGGFLFGLWLGTGLNILAATMGASIIFNAARLGWGEALSARIEASDGKLKEVRAGLLDNAVSVMLMMRLVPVVPFFVTNLLPALVGVRFWSFLWTTALGIVPGALVFTSIGVGVGEVFDRGEQPDLSLLWAPHVIGPILGLAALAALPMVIRLWRGKKG
ncbi:MAG: TVP38/TMEM64 family protein [Rhodobacteraceae bacterium]|nr:TVP38/TMEM64 family protein [Paracoccaceae bacterium]